MSISKAYTQAVTGCAVISVLLGIISLSVVFWVSNTSDTDDTMYGLFLEQTNGDKTVATKCHSDMPDTQCGYLNSAKGCGIISILFASFACIVHVYNYSVPNKNSMTTAVAAILGTIQTIFGIICLVLFSYFTDDYLTIIDDINIEYDINPNTKYGWAFYLMIISVVFGGLVSILSFSAIYTPLLTLKKSASSERLMQTKPEV